MGWAKVAFIMVVIQFQAMLLPVLPARARAAAQELGSCHGVECGRGSCRASGDKMLGFVCECEPGWNQLLGPNKLFGFLPCVIPNCTFSSACYNDSMVKPIPVAPISPSFSLFDPCLWSYCGGGSCVGMSGFRHRCECKEGFTNILNIPIFPCFKDCAVGADCVNLGFTLSNGSFPTSPTGFANSGGSRGSSFKTLLWFILVTSLGMASTLIQV